MLCACSAGQPFSQPATQPGRRAAGQHKGVFQRGADVRRPIRFINMSSIGRHKKRREYLFVGNAMKIVNLIWRRANHRQSGSRTMGGCAGSSVLQTGDNFWKLIYILPKHTSNHVDFCCTTSNRRTCSHRQPDFRKRIN